MRNINAGCKYKAKTPKITNKASEHRTYFEILFPVFLGFFEDSMVCFLIQKY